MHGLRGEGIGRPEGLASLGLVSKLLLTPCHSWSPVLDPWGACALLEGSLLILAICLAACEGLWHLEQSFVFLKDGINIAVSYGDK